MTDREMLELAAKAASIPVAGFHSDGDVERMDGGWWNPLEDDGDAFQLMVELGLSVIRYGKILEVTRPEGMSRRAVLDHPVSDCLASSYCRAIVRAAAEIGRAMP